MRSGRLAPCRHADLCRSLDQVGAEVRDLHRLQENRRRAENHLHRRRRDRRPRGPGAGPRGPGRQYPGTINVFENAWEQLIPILDFAPDIRRVIYTTDAIESMNRNLSKLVKTSGHLPSDDAAMKMLYLGIRNMKAGTSTVTGRSPPDGSAAPEPSAGPAP
nr:transposase [Streptomyces noursei]